MNDYILLGEIKKHIRTQHELDDFLESNAAHETRRGGQPTWPRMMWERWAERVLNMAIVARGISYTTAGDIRKKPATNTPKGSMTEYFDKQIAILDSIEAIPPRPNPKPQTLERIVTWEEY